MKYIVSACLLGHSCRYDGGSNYNSEIADFLRDKKYYAVCPEVYGKLGTPRLPSEAIGNMVFSISGTNVTKQFEEGASVALKIAKRFGATIAILKARSPSCGHLKIYDGSFTKTLTNGNGVFVKKCLENGIQVYTEEEFIKLIKGGN